MNKNPENITLPKFDCLVSRIACLRTLKVLPKNPRYKVRFKNPLPKIPFRMPKNPIFYTFACLRTHIPAKVKSCHDKMLKSVPKYLILRIHIAIKAWHFIHLLRFVGTWQIQLLRQAGQAKKIEKKILRVRKTKMKSCDSGNRWLQHIKKHIIMCLNSRAIDLAIQRLT